LSEVWLTAKRNVDQTVSRADASLYPNRKRREDDGHKAEEDVATAHYGLVVSVCCAACVYCVEKTARLKWRVSNALFRSHVMRNLDALNAAVLNDDKGGASVMFPTAPSCIYQITCLRAVSQYR